MTKSPVLIYSFVLMQVTYDQCSAFLTDIHDFTCVIEGFNKDNDEALKMAIRKLITESPNHVYNFLAALKPVRIGDHQHLFDAIYDDYEEAFDINNDDDNDDRHIDRALAEKHIEDLITIYYDFALTDNDRYLKYSCIAYPKK
jgi:hypothetical protein